VKLWVSGGVDLGDGVGRLVAEGEGSGEGVTPPPKPGELPGRITAMPTAPIAITATAATATLA
jgi:hypothetical protein